jgi:hypothetical protein
VFDTALLVDARSRIADRRMCDRPQYLSTFFDVWLRRTVKPTEW